jgi:hypothetical protein
MTLRDRVAAGVLFFLTLNPTLPASAVTAVDDFFLAVENRALSLPNSQLLANDDIDPKLRRTVVFLDKPEFGKVTILDDKVQFVPAPGFVGIDSFRYHLETSEGASNPATVRIHVSPYYAPVVGDWIGAGNLLVGIYVNAPVPYFLLCEALGEEPVCPRYWAPPAFWGMLPIAGNWDADPADEVGLYNPATGRFYLRDLGPNRTLPPVVDFKLGQGGKGNVPLAGDWDGDGVASVGIRRAVDGFFGLRNTNGPGSFDHFFELTGSPPDALPFFGDWDLAGGDSVGLYDPQTGIVSLRNELTSGPPDFQAPLSIDAALTPVWGEGRGNQNFLLVFFDRVQHAFYHVSTWPDNAAIKVIVPTDPDG